MAPFSQAYRKPVGMRMSSKHKPEKIVPEKKRINLLRINIRDWFRRNGRDYPWRKTDDPYKILMAEMMLQRTKADQVVGIYNEFFNEYKCPEEIIKSDKARITTHLKPLGLNWRIENLIEVSKVLIKSYNGIVPSNREELKHLPGVGDYIAGIVLSLAFNKNEWIVDSNVVRIFKRYFGMKTSKEGRRDSHIITTAKLFSSENNAKEANLGLVDFGAIICLPKKPKCSECILKRCCQYKKQGNHHYKNKLNKGELPYD